MQYYWTCPGCGVIWVIHEHQFEFFPCKCVNCGKVPLTEEDVRKCHGEVAPVYDD